MLDFSQLFSATLYSFENKEKELLYHISLLQKNFTKERSLRLSDYLEDEKMVSAYTLFYMYSNWPKYNFVADKIPESLKDRYAHCHFIDVGTGPGTYLWAHEMMFSDRAKKLVGIDLSKIMLKQGRLLKDNFFAESEVYLEKNYSASLKKSLEGKERILCFGNSFNEMTDDVFCQYIEDVDPTFLNLIFLGTKEVFQRFKKLRDGYLLEKFDVIYPCLTQENCPMTLEGGDWCHQYLYHKWPLAFEQLSQKLKINRRYTPFFGGLFVKKGLWKKETTEDEVVFMRTIFKNKGEAKMLVCNGQSELEKISFPLKILSKEQKKNIPDLLAGIKMRIKREDGKIKNIIW